MTVARTGLGTWDSGDGGVGFWTPRNWRWRSEPVETGPAVVFDVDGVLADAAGRQHFLDGPKRDWDGFFAASAEDPLISEVADLLDVLNEAMTVLLLTARPMSNQVGTLNWLDRYGLRWDLLVMREDVNWGASREFKRRSVAEFRHYGFDLKLAFEDDRRNVSMFHEMGVPCVYIHSGYYD